MGTHFLKKIVRNIVVPNLMCFSRSFHSCTSSSSGFSVGRQKRYVASTYMFMKSFVNVCDVESEDNRYVRQIVNCILFQICHVGISAHQSIGSFVVTCRIKRYPTTEIYLLHLGDISFHTKRYLFYLFDKSCYYTEANL